MIRTGILGASETACRYAHTIKESGNLELTGCFSPDYHKSKEFASQFGLVAYPSVEALFNYADALIVTDFCADFLSITEKALKNFKHILIANPFLARFEEVQFLRKLSEESGVSMQIAGGFKFQTILSDYKIQNCYFADLKHSIKVDCNNSGARYIELLIHDISLLLIVLKGMPKKLNLSFWDESGKNPDFMSARIDLDNGCAANILLNQMASENSFSLNLYSNNGISKYDTQYLTKYDSIEWVINELDHFYTCIDSDYLTSTHNDIIFQALELAHTIKSKTFRHNAINIQN
jgi:hypothetical protein